MQFVLTGIMKLKNSKLRAAPALEYLPADFDQERLPSFDGSDCVLKLFKFTAPIIRGRQYYFDQDSFIDSCRITGMRVHFNLDFIFETDMFHTYKDEATAFNVINLSDYANVLITLCSKRAGEIIQRLPASTFLSTVRPPSTGIYTASPLSRKALDIEISTQKSFIEFTAVPFTALPLIVPISLYYEKK